MKENSGKSYHCCALLDGVSQNNFITTALAKRLNFKITSTNIPEYSKQHVVLPVSGSTEAIIYSNCNSYKTNGSIL
jgi:hypothetical protein